MERFIIKVGSMCPACGFLVLGRRQDSAAAHFHFSVFVRRAVADCRQSLSKSVLSARVSSSLPVNREPGPQQRCRGRADYTQLTKAGVVRLSEKTATARR